MKEMNPTGKKMNYTRESLIDICERAIVAEKDWLNRDSSSATRQLGELWALLKSDCKFKVVTSGSWKTDDDTIVVEVQFSGFMSFEIGEGHETETFYLPTEKRLKEANGKDWY